MSKDPSRNAVEAREKRTLVAVPELSHGLQAQKFDKRPKTASELVSMSAYCSIHHENPATFPSSVSSLESRPQSGSNILMVGQLAFLLDVATKATRTGPEQRPYSVALLWAAAPGPVWSASKVLAKNRR